MNTLLLDSNWDIGTDELGNLAVATGPTAVAQDVACACRTWFGELWYDVTQGVHYELILGENPPFQFIKMELAREALRVPMVGSVLAFLTGPGPKRVVGGQMQVYDTLGNLIAVTATTDLPGDLPWWVNAADETASGGTT
ncbi:MAG: hypothetical protein KGO96_10555 [Elusimicrobia bacterium]|nr:hypothetical protein [Elusimicrobiota bacterium]